jgi:glycogen debranching enzyme
LLRQGAAGYQLTWMDAKVEGWVVTPRQGKAVEINALWYNALLLCVEWMDKMDIPVRRQTDLKLRLTSPMPVFSGASGMRKRIASMTW